MNPLVPLMRALHARSVRFVVIGVAGANHYAPSGQAAFITQDHDFFLPPDPDNLVNAWAASDDAGLELWSMDEPLDRPRDRWLAERVVERRALTRATGPDDLLVDLSLVMKGYEFETVWAERREFVIDGASIPVARLLHIVTSKHATSCDTGRGAARGVGDPASGATRAGVGAPRVIKDKLFLATHRDALEQLLKRRDV